MQDKRDSYFMPWIYKVRVGTNVILGNDSHLQVVCLLLAVDVVAVVVVVVVVIVVVVVVAWLVGCHGYRP